MGKAYKLRKIVICPSILRVSLKWWAYWKLILNKIIRISK